MNFLNLRYFLVAAEELNFTKAANRLFISQQSLSNHISKLEEYFGAPLFDRTPPLTLTKEGECLVRHAKKILQIRDNALTEIHDIKDSKSGDLVIGCTRLWGRAILPQIMTEYRRRFPSIRLRLMEANTTEVETSLRSGKVDISVGYVPNDQTDLSVVALCQEITVLMVPDSVLEQYHPGRVRETKLALKSSGDISLVADCPFMTMYPSTTLGATTEHIFKSVGINPPIVLQSGSIGTLLSMCFEGMGCILCPEIMASHALFEKKISFSDTIGIYPLNFSEAKRVISINHLKGKYLPQAAVSFIDLAKECVATKPITISHLL